MQNFLFLIISRLCYIRPDAATTLDGRYTYSIYILYTGVNAYKTTSCSYGYNRTSWV